VEVALRVLPSAELKDGFALRYFVAQEAGPVDCGAERLLDVDVFAAADGVAGEGHVPVVGCGEGP
jgi:hypothetical protein